MWILFCSGWRSHSEWWLCYWRKQEKWLFLSKIIMTFFTSVIFSLPSSEECTQVISFTVIFMIFHCFLNWFKCNCLLFLYTSCLTTFIFFTNFTSTLMFWPHVCFLTVLLSCQCLFPTSTSKNGSQLMWQWLTLLIFSWITTCIIAHCCIMRPRVLYSESDEIIIY